MIASTRGGFDREDDVATTQISVSNLDGTVVRYELPARIDGALILGRSPRRQTRKPIVEVLDRGKSVAGSLISEDDV
jgi:hypothetical protein